MNISLAHVPTDKAERYLQQLCKHWSHKFRVTFSETEGQIDFLDGRSCGLKARDSELEVSAVGPADQLAQLQTIIEKHVQRFAHREGELAFRWAPVPE